MSTMPYEYVSASSGSRSGLPPTQAVVLPRRVRRGCCRIARPSRRSARTVRSWLSDRPPWSHSSDRRRRDRWCRSAGRAAAGTAPGCSASALRADSCRAAGRCRPEPNRGRACSCPYRSRGCSPNSGSPFRTTACAPASGSCRIGTRNSAKSSRTSNPTRSWRAWARPDRTGRSTDTRRRAQL